MSSIEYRLVTCQSALNRVTGMPFRWSLNPYRGCSHSCQYCYARGTHRYLDLDVGRDFERIIYVKTNVADALRRDLRSGSWRHESIAIGTATDPYQPAEGKFRLTRQCLEVLADQANPLSVTTKGTLIIRDIDVLSDLARSTDVSVHFSLITLDEDVWRRVEPGTPPPRSRLRAIERLSAAGIPTSVFLMPILPGLTDRPDQLRAVVKAAADHGATGVASTTLRLAADIRDWYLDFVSREYPGLLAAHERGYAGRADAPRPWVDRVQLVVREAVASSVFATGRIAVSRPRVGYQFALPIVD